MKRLAALKRITRKEALGLLNKADLLELGKRADEIRRKLHPEGIGTFVIDRNINYTNVCLNKCAFCAFWRNADAADAYVLDEKTLFRKIGETLALGGTQILLQGGLNPELDILYYLNLLRTIKRRFNIIVHGFSPPEISFIADSAGISVREALQFLKGAGLDSVPGGGAEILSDRVRKIVSPRKISSSRWLEVMEEAHGLGMRTTATMMFGSIEGPEDIVAHLDLLRELQDRTGGFTAFIPWSFQPGNTELRKKRRYGFRRTVSSVEYLRVLALSRIYLDNFENIQSSWVTQGLKLAQVALRFGANDIGSTMIEENVVSATGVNFNVSKDDIIRAIREAGYSPAQRDTFYNIVRSF